MSLAELEQFSNFKVELEKLGEDIRRTVRIIQGLQKSGYNIETITQLLSGWETSIAIRNDLKKKIDSLTVHTAELQEKNDDLWNSLWINRGKLSLCEDLQGLGFGLKGLKQLSGTRWQGGYCK